MIEFKCCENKAGAAQVIDIWTGYTPFDGGTEEIYLAMSVNEEYYYDGVRQKFCDWLFKDGSCIHTSVTRPEDRDFICSEISNWNPYGAVVSVTIDSPVEAHTEWSVTFAGHTRVITVHFLLSSPKSVAVDTLMDGTCSQVDVIWPDGDVPRDYDQVRRNGVEDTSAVNPFAGYVATRYACDSTHVLDEYGVGSMWCIPQCTGDLDTCLVKMRQLELVCRKFSTVGLPPDGWRLLGFQRADGQPTYDDGQPGTCQRIGPCNAVWGQDVLFESGDCRLSRIVETFLLNTRVTPALEPL